MSIQIAKICIFSHDGRKRELRLVPGHLNILTGPTERGKSQLIEIIDYCFGRGTPNLAPGPITKKVAWFGLLLTTGTEEVFVARKAADAGQKSSESIYVDRGTFVTVPPSDQFRATHNVESWIFDLNELLGISTNATPVSESSGRDPFEATVRHAILLCFQAQHEIANPDLLFHRQGDDGGAIGRDMLATLPYLLGAVSEQSVALESEATTTRREIRVADRQLREEALLVQDKRSRADTLYAEAAAVGLTSSLKELATYDEVIQALVDTASWTPQSAKISGGEDEYQRAIETRQSTMNRLREVRHLLDEAQRYTAEQNAFVTELTEQRARLQSISLYEHLDNQQAFQITGDIRRELAAVDSEIDKAAPPTADLLKYTNALEVERSTLLADLQRSDQRLDALGDQFVQLRQLRDGDLRRSAVAGRISLFLEGLRRVSNTSALSIRATQLRTRLATLEERIDATADEATLNDALAVIGGLMGSWAGELQHEYRGTAWRLDTRRGSVVTRGPLGTVPMSSMGGSRNHLGCHLFAHVALHSFMRGNDRPAPGFLFLDRPSIGFYENKPVSDDPKMQRLKAADQQYVNKLFAWLDSVVIALGGSFQIIVTEHLSLSNDLVFSKALIEDWWATDGSLVPIDWPDRG